MAILVMSNGAQRTLSEKDARTIWSIKRGYKKPASPKQARFVAAVHEVRFDTEMPAKRYVSDIIPRKITDAKVRQIVHDSTLSGHDKMRQITNAIRERHHIPVIVPGESKEHELKQAWVPDGLTEDRRKRYLEVCYCVHCLVASPQRITTTAGAVRVRRREGRQSDQRASRIVRLSGR